MENTIREFDISTLYDVGDRFIYNGETYEVDKSFVGYNLLPEREIGCHKIPIDFGQIFDPVTLSYSNLNIDVGLDRHGYINKWNLEIEPELVDVLDFVGTTEDKLTQADVNAIDKSKFIAFLLDRYKDEAIDEAIEYGDDDDVDWDE